MLNYNLCVYQFSRIFPTYTFIQSYISITFWGNFLTYTFIRTRRLFGTLEYSHWQKILQILSNQSRLYTVSLESPSLYYIQDLNMSGSLFWPAKKFNISFMKAFLRNFLVGPLHYFEKINFKSGGILFPKIMSNLCRPHAISSSTPVP